MTIDIVRRKSYGRILRAALMGAAFGSFCFFSAGSAFAQDAQAAPTALQPAADNSAPLEENNAVPAPAVLPEKTFDEAAKKKIEDALGFEDAFELVLQVKRKGEVLSAGLLGFQKGYSDYYLPLKGLADILGFETNLDLEQGVMRGWLFQPANQYVLDTNANSYQQGELAYTLQPNDIIVQDYGSGFGDIYVHFDVLNEIWPLELVMDFEKLALEISAEKKLPYELKRERLAQRDNLLRRQSSGGLDYEGFVKIDNDYRFISRPIVDISTSTTWDNGEGKWSNRTNLSGKNDLFYMTADYNLNFLYDNDDFISPDDMRFTLTRRAFEGETMPLGVRELILGDIGLRSPDLTVHNNSGRGVSISSRPVRRSGSFDEIVVEGSATPGWEFELYRNSELLEFGIVPENGFYHVDQVELKTGNNTIKVLLYGPGGQVEERIKNYRIGSLLPPGEFEYQASVVDTSDNLISFHKEDNDRANATGGDQDGYAYNASLRTGVNRFMSAFTTFTRAVTQQGRMKKYASIGTDISLGPAQANIEAYKELGGGTAIDTRVATSLFGWRTNLRTQVMNDFESDRIGYGDTARIFTARASASNRYALGFGTLGLSGAAEYEKTRDESTKKTIEFSSNLSTRGYGVGNRLTARYYDSHFSTLDGLANAKVRLGKKTGFRGLLSYRVKPHYSLDNVNLTLDYRASDKLSGNLNVNHNIQSTKTNVGANVSYDFDKFLGSVSTVWREDDGVNVTLRASTSLAPYGSGGDYIMKSRSLQNQNAVNATMYVDKNMNSIYDEGELAVNDAVLILGKKENLPTDEAGFASLIQGGWGQYEPLTYKPDSAPNPFLASEHEGYQMILRPGVMQSLEFAMVETGGVDGSVYFDDGRPVPGLKLQLIDSKGDIVKDTITSFDGFYSFEFVKPGQYAVRPDPSVNVVIPTRVVSVSHDAPFVYGTNMQLLKNAGLPESAIDIDAQSSQQNMSSILSTLSSLQGTLRVASDL